MVFAPKKEFCTNKQTPAAYALASKQKYINAHSCLGNAFCPKRKADALYALASNIFHNFTFSISQLTKALAE